jgi:hypothetical protein
MRQLREELGAWTVVELRSDSTADFAVARRTF